MATRTIELPAAVTVETGKTGQAVKLKLADVPENVLAMAVINGFTSALNDVSRGKDENDKPNSDAVWHSMREKRADPWLAGEWSFSRQGAGAGIVTRMKEAYVMEQSQLHNVAPSVIASKIKETVQAVFGKEESATFPRFLDAIATQYVKANKGAELDDIRQKLETKYRDAAIAMNAEREEASKTLDLSQIVL